MAGFSTTVLAVIAVGESGGGGKMPPGSLPPIPEVGPQPAQYALPSLPWQMIASDPAGRTCFDPCASFIAMPVPEITTDGRLNSRLSRYVTRSSMAWVPVLTQVAFDRMKERDRPEDGKQLRGVLELVAEFARAGKHRLDFRAGPPLHHAQSQAADHLQPELVLHAFRALGHAAQHRQATVGE